MVSNCVKTRSLLQPLQAYITSLDFLKALSILVFLILLTNQELKILTPFRTSAILVNLKTPFLSKPFISLHQDSINNSKVHLEVIVSGFVRLLLININTSAIFYYNFISSYYIHFNLQGGIVAASSLVGFSVSSLFSSLVGSLISSLISSLVGSSVSSSSLGYRYSFTTIVLKLVGPLGSYILYISPSILSSLNRPVHLLLCPVLPLRYISTSKLRGRLWIMVTDRPFYQFSILLTYFFTLILTISSITFFIAAACYIIEGTSGSSSPI